MTLDELQRQIEKARCEMHELAAQAGLGAPEVLQKSQELDKLLNQFYQAKENETHAHFFR
jgi:hypothetical protein